MSRSGTANSDSTGFATRVFTAFGADIDFLAGNGFVGETAQLTGRSCRGILAVGAGILQMIGDDAVLVPIDVGALGGSFSNDCSYRGVESTGTTFAGTLVVTW
jgi:hypothetical protein